MLKVSKYHKPIKSKSPSRNLNENFITLDIETYINQENKHEPYLICYFDGKRANDFYLTDYKSSEDMIKACILSLCRFKYNRYKIYIHNLANFDGIFLLRNLVTLGELKVLLNKGKLISIDL